MVEAISAVHGSQIKLSGTPERIERIRRAVTKHGCHSAAARAERGPFRMLFRHSRILLDELSKPDERTGGTAASGPCRARLQDLHENDA